MGLAKCKVILTSDRTLMSNYGNSLFYGFISTAPRASFLSEFVFKAVFNKVPVDENGRAILAPQGLRRIESAIIRSGLLKREEVAVIIPEKIQKFLSEDTKVIGISTFDPLGKGPASTTISGPFGIVHEEPFNAYYFRKLVSSEAVQKARSQGVVVMVGGPGAWQLGYKEMERMGIDVVVEGEGESIFPRVIESILDGKLKVPVRITADIQDAPKAEDIPPLLGATVGGLVEVSRGCGRGCGFCTPTLRKLRHRPLDAIIQDVKTNVENGQTNICLHAEDVLRYGTTALVPNHERVLELFKSVTSVPGVKSVGISHAELASIASSPSTVKAVSEILGLERHAWLGFQTGIETGSISIIERYMCRKPAPFKPVEWRSVVESAFSICDEYNWVPAATLIVNLPGEKENDILQTIELVETLKNYRSFIVPLLYVPATGDENKPMRFLEDANQYHLELYRVVWRHNLRWIEELANDYSKKNNPAVKFTIRSAIKFVRGYLNKKVEEVLDGALRSRASIYQTPETH
ncbi:MAG: B12-binding domain-containing radical SAM protein [Candidatus Methanomethyliaceae archaeon]|nr:B12-binding domain-containing radical SAM protein [Candidatus Methanomethyliaceae archaeon]